MGLLGGGVSVLTGLSGRNLALLESRRVRRWRVGVIAFVRSLSIRLHDRATDSMQPRNALRLVPSRTDLSDRKASYCIRLHFG